MALGHRSDERVAETAPPALALSISCWRRLGLEIARIGERHRANLFDDQLAYLHAREKRDWVLGEIDHFERDHAFPPSVNRWCGEMNQQPYPRE